MNQNVVKIVGIRVQENRKKPGTHYYNYYCMRDFTDYDLQNCDCSGKACSVEFTSNKLDCQVGDEVELKYTVGFQGRASLVGCTVIKPAGSK